jgi:hypothetical protein
VRKLTTSTTSRTPLVRGRNSLTVSCQAMTCLSPPPTRGHATCTMDLVCADNNNNNNEKTSRIVFSTLQYMAEPDVPVLYPERRRPHANDEKEHSLLRQFPNQSIAAEEMNLVQAAERRLLYDKIILLVQHGEALTDNVETALPENHWASAGTNASSSSPAWNSSYYNDPESLTGRGIGQSLNLSRRMAIFCNDETQLVPELVLVAPLKRVLQTTFLAFPYHTPHHALRPTPWICHPLLAVLDNHHHHHQQHEEEDSVDLDAVRDLQREFCGIDCSLLLETKKKQHHRGHHSDTAAASLVVSGSTEHEPTRHRSSSSSSRDEVLLQRADALLAWLQTRSEHVVVGTLLVVCCRFGLDCWLLLSTVSPFLHAIVISECTLLPPPTHSHSIYRSFRQSREKPNGSTILVGD